MEHTGLVRGHHAFDKDCTVCRLRAEMQEVANQLMELYDKCSETTEPEIYGTILGLHERLEKALSERK